LVSLLLSISIGSGVTGSEIDELIPCKSNKSS